MRPGTIRFWTFALCSCVVLMTVSAPAQAQADLIVNSVDDMGVVADHQNLTIAGSVDVDLENIGTAATGVPFNVAVFEDVNGNGTYETGTDDTLGTLAVAGLANGASVVVSVALSGSVDFRENLIYAAADTGDAVAETNEANNLSNTGFSCELIPPPGILDPGLEWSWTSSAVEPNALNVMMTPSVIDLTGDGVPEVVFGTTSSTGGGSAESGVLRALDGSSGAELFTVSNPALRISTTCSIATGDIDGDSMPEIIACKATNSSLYAFEHDGTLKWESDQVEAVNWGAVSIADLDMDGSPEIILGRQVLDANGTLLWTGGGGAASQSNVGAISLVADIDGDGSPDVVAGNTVYNADGTTQWTAGLSDGHNAVANFDGDVLPEIVLVSAGSVWLLEHDGTIVWGPVPIPGGGAGGPPTIADYDGDGLPEIGIAGASRYVVLEHDGTEKWQTVTQDNSSNRTGSSVFDFDGDGAAEVVYRDELHLRIYRGSDGFTLFSIPMSSCTWHEYVLVADVDADGNAEIVAVANNNCGLGPQRGVFVFGSITDSWIPTRTIWNQHSYHITNINNDGTIPTVEADNWLTPGGDPFNNYRQNVLFGAPVLAAPDLTASHITVSGSDVAARIGNGGSILVASGLPVSFYDGDPTGAGVLLGTSTTSVSLQPGEFEIVSLTLGGTVPPTVCASADDLGALVGTENECDETNNIHSAGTTPPQFDPPTPCGQTLSVSATNGLSFTVTASDADPGDSVTMTASGVPSGATLTPALPSSGNPVSTTFSWSRSVAQIGTHVVVFTVVDSTGQQASCSVTIEVAECYLLLGTSLGTEPFAFGGQTLETQISDIYAVYPVTMEDTPVFPVAGLSPREMFGFMGNGLMEMSRPVGQAFFGQVVMWNPEQFPSNPAQWTEALAVTVRRFGSVQSERFGTSNGMTIWADVFDDEQGQTWLSLPFGIDW